MNACHIFAVKKLHVKIFRHFVQYKFITMKFSQITVLYIHHAKFVNLIIFTPMQYLKSPSTISLSLKVMEQCRYQSTELEVISPEFLLSVPTLVMYQAKLWVGINLLISIIQCQVNKGNDCKLIIYAFKVLINAAGVDYMSLSNFRIRWQADQVDPRYIPNSTGADPAFVVTIIDDDIPEPPEGEYFEIVLTLNPGNNRNGFFYPRAVGRVTIVDDDTRDRKFLM